VEKRLFDSALQVEALMKQVALAVSARILAAPHLAAGTGWSWPRRRRRPASAAEPRRRRSWHSRRRRPCPPPRLAKPEQQRSSKPLRAQAADGYADQAARRTKTLCGTRGLSPDFPLTASMGRLRFELRTNRLKAECSTAELATLWSRPVGVAPPGSFRDL
jgi:hypothetical protein